MANLLAHGSGGSYVVPETSCDAKTRGPTDRASMGATDLPRMGICGARLDGYPIS